MKENSLPVWSVVFTGSACKVLHLFRRIEFRKAGRHFADLLFLGIVTQIKNVYFTLLKTGIVYLPEPALILLTNEYDPGILNRGHFGNSQYQPNENWS